MALCHAKEKASGILASPEAFLWFYNKCWGLGLK